MRCVSLPLKQTNSQASAEVDTASLKTVVARERFVRRQRSNHCIRNVLGFGWLAEWLAGWIWIFQNNNKYVLKHALVFDFNQSKLDTDYNAF